MTEIVDHREFLPRSASRPRPQPTTVLQPSPRFNSRQRLGARPRSGECPPDDQSLW
jgi:hypothetical protein